MRRFRFNRALVLATTAATVVVIGAITAAAWLAGGGIELGGEAELPYVPGPPAPSGPAGLQGSVARPDPRVPLPHGGRW